MASSQSAEQLAAWEQSSDMAGEEATSGPSGAAAGVVVSDAEGPPEGSGGGRADSAEEQAQKPSGSVSSVSAVTGSSEPKQVATAEEEMVSRPTDEEIIKQHNTIIEEEKKNSPLIGPKQPLTTVEEEYKNGNEIFIEKLQSLKHEYGFIRRVRRDGNCFFRAFIFAYLETLITTRNWQERDRVAKCIDACREKLVKAGFQELVFEDALAVIQEKIAQVGRLNDPLTVEEWDIVMREEDYSSYIVMFLRLLTSCEIQLRRDYFAPFIMGVSEICDVELFCRRMVEPIGEESDEVHIRALTDALMIPVRVHPIDSSFLGDGKKGLEVDYCPEGCTDASPLVHLLYRPGHYDILYPINS